MKKTILFVLFVGLVGALGLFFTITVQASQHVSPDQLLEGDLPEMNHRQQFIRRLRQADQLMLETGHWAWLLGDVDAIETEALQRGIDPMLLRMIRAIQTVDPDLDEEAVIETPALVLEQWRDTRPFKHRVESLVTSRQAVMTTIRSGEYDDLEILVETWLEIQETLDEFQAMQLDMRERTEPFRQQMRARWERIRQYLRSTR